MNGTKVCLEAFAQENDHEIIGWKAVYDTDYLMENAFANGKRCKSMLAAPRDSTSGRCESYAKVSPSDFECTPFYTEKGKDKVRKCKYYFESTDKVAYEPCSC